MQWLKHAFAVDPPGPADPTPQQRDAVDAVCRQIVKRHLTTPALVFLEMSKPLNYLGSQAMHFFAPVLSVLSGGQGHRHFAAFLEHRGSIDYLCRRLEELEAEAVAKNAQTESNDDLRTDTPDESA